MARRSWSSPTEKESPREAADKYNELTRNDLRNLGISYDLFTRTTTANHAPRRPGSLQDALRQGFDLRADRARRVLRHDRKHPPRPLHRGHVPDLRIHASARRPVRQLREPARPDRPHRPALEDRRHHAGVPRDEPPVPRPARVPRPAHRVDRVEGLTGGRTSATSPSSSPARSSHGRSRATSIGASGFRCRATRKTRTNGSTSGSTPSSATSRPRSNGRRRAPRPTHGATGGRTRRHAHCYFMGKDNIVFHTIIWPSELLGYGDRRRARGRPPADASGQRRRQRVPDHGAPAVQRKPRDRRS